MPEVGSTMLAWVSKAGVVQQVYGSVDEMTLSGGRSGERPRRGFESA